MAATVARSDGRSDDRSAGRSACRSVRRWRAGGSVRRSSCPLRREVRRPAHRRLRHRVAPAVLRGGRHRFGLLGGAGFPVDGVRQVEWTEHAGGVRRAGRDRDDSGGDQSDAPDPEPTTPAPARRRVARRSPGAPPGRRRARGRESRPAASGGCWSRFLRVGGSAGRGCHGSRASAGVDPRRARRPRTGRGPSGPPWVQDPAGLPGWWLVSGWFSESGSAERRRRSGVRGRIAVTATPRPRARRRGFG